MAAINRITGSNVYIPELSAAGILYNGEDGIPRFSSRFGWTVHPFLPEAAGRPINICSFSHGLIACHDPISNIYYIGNPGIIDSYTALPETPRQHDLFNSNAVLVSNHPVQQFYHLICPVFDGITVYNFDVYCSRYGRWFSHGRIDLECDIAPDTGVSCRTFAYWLTEAPKSVIRFNVDCSQNMISRILLDRRVLGFPGTILQLGTVANGLGLVSLDANRNPRVILYLLEEGNRWQFQPYVSFNLPISNSSVTRLIRFQSYKAELFFWVDGRLFLWEEGCLRTVNRGEVQIGHGLAHVATSLIPGDFPMPIQNIDRDDDDDDAR